MNPVERLGLKKLLGLSSLYIDSNGCNKAHREAALRSPENKKDYNNCFSAASLSPCILPKDSMVISNIFVTQEEGRGSQSLKKNDNGDGFKQQNKTSTKTKSTYNETGLTRTNSQESQHAPADRPFSVDIVCSSPSTVHSNAVSSVSGATFTTKVSSTSPSTGISMDTSSNSPPPSQHSPSMLSKQISLSDSTCSFRSSTDSLPGAEGSSGRQVRLENSQSTSDIGSSHSDPSSPNGTSNLEPIYAESTKKKRKPQGNGVQSQPESPNQLKSSTQCSELELSGETQRATITVMATHSQENNRTVYLSSPDSAISTQCHFSSPACKDPSSSAFRWPSPSHSSPSLATEASLSPTLHTKPQCSPPIPPKRTTRSPKLGTSSLSPSISSPVPLPEFPKQGTSGLSPSIPSPVPLPELPMLFLVSREGHFKVHTEKHSAAASERWPKSHNHVSGWNCRIEEEEEDNERERKDGKKKKIQTNRTTTSPVTGLVNGAAVWKENSNCKAQSNPPSMTEPGTAPPVNPNNGACQRDTKENSAMEDGKHNGSMPARQALHGSSSEHLAAGKGTSYHEPIPPPPPPKKLHR